MLWFFSRESARLGPAYGHSGSRGYWTPEGPLCWLGGVTETAPFFAFVGDVEDCRCLDVLTYHILS